MMFCTFPFFSICCHRDCKFCCLPVVIFCTLRMTMDLIFVMLMYFVSFEFRKVGVKSIYNMTMVTELLTDGVQIIFS